MNISRLIWIALCAGLLASPAAATPVVDLVVVGPTEDVFSLFGHAALIVRDHTDTEAKTGVVFNFGITDFDRPNYVLDFLTGRVKFWGKKKHLGRSIARWSKRDRTITRYPLNLSPGQAARLIARMENDVLPEHREYTYDPFREDCATRLRDYLDTYTGGAVYAATGDVPSGRSFRDDVRMGFAGMRPLLLGTELAFGVSFDEPRTMWEMSYLPSALPTALALVTLGDAPLLGAPVVMNLRQGPNPYGEHPDSALAFLLLAAALTVGVGVFSSRLGPKARALLVLSFTLGSTLLGTLLVFAALTSSWIDLQQNWLVLCFVPLDVLLVWPAARLFVWAREVGELTRGYLWIRMGVTALLVVLGLFAGLFHGPVPPRVLALAGLFMLTRCLPSSTFERKGA